MKNFILFCLILSGLNANATTLEFDLVGVSYKNHHEVKIDVPKLNKALAEKGLAGLPEKIVVGKNAKAYGQILLNRIAEANKVMPAELRFVIDNGYLYEYPAICYRGEATEVPTIIKAMSDTFLNSEQNILALRYGSKAIIHDKNFKSEEKLNEAYEGGNRETKAWLNYDKSSKSILVMSNLGPQGDGLELYATVIKPCK